MPHSLLHQLSSGGGAAPTDVFATADFIYVGIDSFDSDGFVSTPLSFNNSMDFVNMAAALSDGDLGIYFRFLEDSAGNTTTLYYAVGDTEDLYFSDTTSGILDPSISYYGMSYGADEKERLRERFGQPENSNTESLVEETINQIAEQVSALSLSTRLSIKKTHTKPFENNELSVLQDEELTQNVAVSLLTVSGSSGVTSTSILQGGR